MKAKEILLAAGMSSAASVYSGRGATTSDLTGNHLQKIWELILKHHGEKPAEAFVCMVEAMDKMAATAFINELYSLESNAWKFDAIARHSGIEIAKNENGEYDYGHGLMSVTSAFASATIDDSGIIRNRFLSEHGKVVKKDTMYVSFECNTHQYKKRLERNGHESI